MTRKFDVRCLTVSSDFLFCTFSTTYHITFELFSRLFMSNFHHIWFCVNLCGLQVLVPVTVLSCSYVCPLLHRQCKHTYFAVSVRFFHNYSVSARNNWPLCGRGGCSWLTEHEGNVFTVLHIDSESYLHKAPLCRMHIGCHRFAYLLDAVYII